MTRTLKTFFNIAAVTLAGMAIAQSALASERGGWEFTRWEMTLPEVLQASGGRVQPIDDPEKIKACSTWNGHLCRALIPDYKIGSLSFKVTFNFDQRQLLSHVSLQESGSVKFYELERQLLGAFGNPINRQGGGIPTRTWRDERKGNILRLLLIADYVVLDYTPISSGF